MTVPSARRTPSRPHTGGPPGSRGPCSVQRYDDRLAGRHRDLLAAHLEPGLSPASSVEGHLLALHLHPHPRRRGG